MEDFRRAIRDIIEDVEYLPTLRRAAEISPFITERTIGPDIIHTTLNEETTKESTNAAIEKTQQAEQKNSIENAGKIHVKDNILSQSEQLSKPMDGATGHNHMDVEIVRCFILRRQIEENIKREVYKELCEVKRRHDEFMHEKSLIIQQEIDQERNEWLARKHYNEARILQLAEEQSQKEIEEYNYQLEAIRKKRQHEIHQLAVRAVLQCQMRFNLQYELIREILLYMDKQAIAPCVQFNVKLREQIEMFEQLTDKIKNCDCGLNEIKMAEELCFTLAVLQFNLLDACAQLQENKQNGANVMLKEKHHQQNQQEQQQQTILETDASKLPVQQQSTTAEVLQSSSPAPVQASSTATTILLNPTTEFPLNGVASECFEFYMNVCQFYREKMEIVKVLQRDDSMKGYRLECQKSINIPVNAISGASKQHLKDKYDKLCTFVLSQNNLCRDYCVMLMSKKFVSQAETTISSNPHCVFPIASMIVTLWKKIPEFGQIFLANIFKESPFMVPYYIEQTPEQSFEEYAGKLGYRIINGQLEEQHMYLKRQAGIARLYAAVMITKGRQEQPDNGNSTLREHPYGLENAWRWFANIVQLTPLPDICATVIMEFLNILGHDLWKIYGKQFTKLLIYIRKYYFPKLSKVDDGGPKVRFEILLNNLLKEGKIGEPEGMLPPDFW